MNDHQLAHEVATSAGRLLLSTREELRGSPEADIRNEGDRRAHDHILSRLADARPDDVILSEEGKDDRRRLAARRVWIVDPLDGTREFAEGRSDWAVHVALWESDSPPLQNGPSRGQAPQSRLPGGLTAGAVALPGDDLTLSTAEPVAPPPAHAGGPRFVVSRTRPPAVTTALVDALDGVVVPMGSAGAKTMAVLRGQADIYVHAGGQYEWDSAAPVAVAMSAGLHASRIDGALLEYNQSDPYLPDLIVCRPEWAQRVLDEISLQLQA